jgi:hypothetical protein
MGTAGDNHLAGVLDHSSVTLKTKSIDPVVNA